MRNPADIVAAAATGPVLVFGSLPGDGRDLDLLVPDDDLPALREALARAGFRNRGDEWARFAGGSADAVDLVAAAGWELPADELDALFAQGRPVDGFTNLLRPAPHHALLVLARLNGVGPLPPRRRRRLQAAVAEDPGAWAEARRRAPAWRLSRQLERLQAGGNTRRAPPRLRRPRVVALSGIDGSGKSSQAELLRAALERLGFDVAVEWSPYGQSAWLDYLAVPAKKLLGRSRRLAAAEPRDTGLELTPGTALRERSSTVNYAWSAMVTFAHALTQLGTIARHSSHGRVVVFDRYALDSIVHLRFRYGTERRFSFHRRLIGLLAPKPVASFFLDIPAETSLARKDDRWTLADLRQQTDLYRAEVGGNGTVSLDGLRPQHELAAEIAEAVWRALG